jgi:hypothetical protein
LDWLEIVLGEPINLNQARRPNGALTLKPSSSRKEISDKNVAQATFCAKWQQASQFGPHDFAGFAGFAACVGFVLFAGPGERIDH